MLIRCTWDEDLTDPLGTRQGRGCSSPKVLQVLRNQVLSSTCFTVDQIPIHSVRNYSNIDQTRF
jgi:hypothetical protein